MRFQAFEWDGWNVEHLARHAVEPHEAEAVCRSQATLILRGREGRYLAYGRTSAGRSLLIVIRALEGGVARIITARDMTQRERRLYQGRRR